MLDRVGFAFTITGYGGVHETKKEEKTQCRQGLGCLCRSEAAGWVSLSVRYRDESEDSLFSRQVIVEKLSSRTQTGAGQS